ncbi:RNA/RNP complex-1-interacting phosphatase isoform X2 [Mixophyes fleayi]|uniref:RNA/RNP complex-1-interacting phosphatase isoform X2 n=1 Tax=Mixophyes fleayi TaxID=3061075 RepID=UPI003F4DF802
MGFCFLVKFRHSLLRLSVSGHIHFRSLATMKNHPPERWTEYTPVGKRIPGTRFIAFKVPLKKMYDNKLQPGQLFSPSDLIREIEKQNEELGMIVDLTCTKRYYFPQELPRKLKYNKIFTAGQQIPTDKVYNEFKSIVNQYLSENYENDKLIGVHCTHGLNRTGYLVCRYLIDVTGMEPSVAIDKFNKSRGHCMERANYLDDLLLRKTKNHTNVNSGNGPRLPKPAFSQPPRHHTPGPRHSFPQTGGRHPNHTYVNPGSGPGTPRSSHPLLPGPRHSFLQMESNPPQQYSHTSVNPGPGPRAQSFSRPHMPGPRHSFPQMESNPPQQSRGGHNRYKHHRNRPLGDGSWAQESAGCFHHQNGVDPGNGVPEQPSALRFPSQKKRGGKKGATGQASGPRWHGQNGPYQR